VGLRRQKDTRFVPRQYPHDSDHKSLFRSLPIPAQFPHGSSPISHSCLVPLHFIIYIEEIDKQLATLMENNRIKISIGGLLTALDGSQRLSDGTIIILTSNT